MCGKILEAAGKLNMDEYNFFLRGGVVSNIIYLISEHPLINYSQCEFRCTLPLLKIEFQPYHFVCFWDDIGCLYDGNYFSLFFATLPPFKCWIDSLVISITVQVLDREEQMDNPCANWLSDSAWDNVTELDKWGLSSFLASWISSYFRSFISPCLFIHCFMQSFNRSFVNFFIYCYQCWI